MNLRLWACHGLAFLTIVQAAWGQGGPPGGRVSTILTVPSDGNLLYVATNAGILRSQDSGLSWAPAREGLTSRDTTTIAGDGSLLYAATFGAGVFRSRDGGESWQAVTQGLDNLDVLSLAVDPSDPNTAYAGTSNGGVFKTSNAGDQWSSASQGLPQGNYTDLAVDPNNSQVVYAGEANLGLAAGTGNLFRSSNGGQSWAAAAGPAVTAVALAPSDSNTVYVGTVSGIIRTTNAGQSFEPLTLVGFQIGDIAVDPGDANIVYATTPGSGVLTSSDGGVTWFVNPAGLPRTELVSLAINSSDPTIVYTGSNGAGVFRSTDSGTNWQLSSNGLFATDSRAFAIDPVQPSNLLVGIFGGGLFRSSNGGLTWAESRQGLTTLRVEAIAVDPVSPATVYAGSSNPFNPSNGSFFRSTDGGRQWELRASGFPVFSVVAHPRDGRTVYVGTDQGVFRTTDGGATFADASGDDGELAFLTNVDLAIDPNNPSTLFAISLNSFALPNLYEVSRSRDAGKNWRGAGVTERPLLTVAVDPTDSSRVLVGSATGLFRSTDGGDRFSLVQAGLPNEGNVLVSSFAFDVNDNGAIYAATSQGVFKSTDRGGNWQAATAGLEGLVLRSVTADPKNARVLYAATANGGVFKTRDGGVSWEPTGGVTLVLAGGIVGGADFIGGGVAPGEIVSIFGQNMGPTEGVTTVFDENGKLPTGAAGVTVFFGEWRAPLFFVSARQINVQVPFEVAGLEQVEVRVEIRGVTSNVASVAVLESHPGVFQAALNQDNRVNSEQRPAGRGSVVQLFVTGQGLVNPAVMTGQPGPLAPPFPAPTLPVSVTIGGEPATVLFRGLAPGLVGVLQINARLSTRVGSGPVEVLVTIGERVSPVAGTVFVE